MTGITSEEFQKIFDAVDSNNSGRISAQELHDALNGQGEKASMSVSTILISLFDEGEGSIDVSGFMSLYELYVSWTGIFKGFDKDSSGYIEKTELIIALNDLFSSDTSKFTDEYVDAIIAKFGDHKAGALNDEEFIFACAYVKEN